MHPVVRYGIMTQAQEIVPLIPTMTSNTTPSGVASASTFMDATAVAYKAFDNISPSYWGAAKNNVANSWLQYAFTEPKTIYNIDLKTDNASVAPKNIKIQYSTNGSTWNDAKTYLFPSTLSVINIPLDTPATAQYWRVFIIDGYRTDYVEIELFQLYGY